MIKIFQERARGGGWGEGNSKRCLNWGDESLKNLFSKGKNCSWGKSSKGSHHFCSP